MLTRDIQASYGSPAVGNLAFSTTISMQDRNRGRNFRMIHLGDIVPNAPPRPFAHTIPSLLINTAGNTTVTANDIVIPVDGNRPFALVPGGADNDNGHSFYLNKIGACGPAITFSIPSPPSKNGTKIPVGPGEKP
jgi:hypothetical protein